MRWWQRQLKKHFGISAAQVAVRPALPWYWRALQVLALLATGVAMGAWVFAVSLFNPFDVQQVQHHDDVQALQTRTVQLESKLQVSLAAQSNLAKEMAGLQDENMRLKEESAFYKSILSESGASGVPKMHSVKLSKGGRAGEYQYQILLVQSGRHDKMVQGAVQLVLNGTQDGKSFAQHVEPSGQRNGIKVNFKYYQRIEGTFSVPAQTIAQNLQVQYLPTGVSQPALTQTASLPN